MWARPWAYTQVRYGSEPTEREIETLAAVVRHSTLAAAAHALGIKRSTAGHLLGLLYARIGARDRSNAVYLLYRKYGDRFEF